MGLHGASRKLYRCWLPRTDTNKIIADGLDFCRFRVSVRTRSSSTEAEVLLLPSENGNDKEQTVLPPNLTLTKITRQLADC